MSFKEEWSGEMCYAVKHTKLGIWCGYVAIPQGHPWHGVDYDDIDADVHGGLTYASNHKPLHEPDGNWWIGFDCGHAPDKIPGMGFAFHDGTYRDLGFVKGEIFKLFKQAVAARAGLQPQDLLT